MKMTLSTVIKQYSIETESGRIPYAATEWRDNRPEWNRDRCFKCGICYLSCPDSAIAEVDEGFYDVDPERCKGCGICAEQCINEAIAMNPEGK